MYAYSAVWLWDVESEQISAELPRFCANRFMLKLFNTNNVQIILLWAIQLLLHSRQIANRRDKFIKSDSQRTNLLTFINM